MAIKFSYSRVDCFKSCPYKYRLRYLDKLQTIPETNADNALWLGLGVHKGIETTVEEGIAEYKSHYPIVTDEIINWSLQLEYWIPKVKELLPPGGHHEVELSGTDFIGYADYIQGDTIYDFKFSNNVENYLKSPQLSIYKHYLEKQFPDTTIKHLKYIFIPKCAIRQKKDESLFDFRQRLISEMEKLEIRVVEVPFFQESVADFKGRFKEIEEATEFPKNPTRLCNWCEYKEYCLKGEDWKLKLPENKKKKPEVNSMPDVFIYGASYVGKSTFADGSQDCLIISTDGNTDELCSPSILIANEVIVNGRMTTTKLAWEVFKETVDELEKKQNDFKYVAIDLVEDLREMCRVYIYKKMNITHESDAGFGKAYDMVTTEFNTVIKRIKAAGYHLILISKEIEGEVTLKSGGKYTTFKPNIPDKVANILAGLVDISARAFVDSNGKRFLQLGSQEHTFGGGRYQFKVDKCELSMTALVNEIKKSKN